MNNKRVPNDLLASFLEEWNFVDPRNKSLWFLFFFVSLVFVTFLPHILPSFFVLILPLEEGMGEGKQEENCLDSWHVVKLLYLN